ncbi:MAG: hypothetical protein WCI77_05570 [Candidatus Omnitrophota bacterium]
MKTKKISAQSVIEYICVTMVFAAVGIGTFVAANHAAVANLRGHGTNYQSQTNLMGQTTYAGIDKEQYNWPSTWDQAYPGTSSKQVRQFVDNPEQTSGQGGE